MTEQEVATGGMRLMALPEDWQRAVAFAAHPDDMEYGLASAVARWTATGKEVVYVLATRGEAGIDRLRPDECGPLREAEERASAAVVGVRQVEFLGLGDGTVEYGLALRRALARAIRRHRPEAVITIHFGLAWEHGMLNQGDHRAVGLAACDAARDAGNRWIFPELLVEGLEPWGGTRYLFVGNVPVARYGVDVTGYLDRGIASLSEHRAYLEHVGASFDPERFLREMAEETGRRLGCEHAVGCELYLL